MSLSDAASERLRLDSEAWAVRAGAEWVGITHWVVVASVGQASTTGISSVVIECYLGCGWPPDFFP
jgi:hypothetical protein